jgi:prolyl 4-hydroxylase
MIPESIGTTKNVFVCDGREMRVRLSIRKTRKVPRVLLIDDFLSCQEAEALIALSNAEGIKESETYDEEADASGSSGRTSVGVGFDYDRPEPILVALRERFAQLLDTEDFHLEATNVVMYTEGAEYEPHFDTDEECDSEPEGHRISTCVVYLSNVESGGETEFPELGVRVAPRIGSLLYFENVYKGKTISGSLHAGRPVPSNQQKWIITMWERERGYTD